MSLLSGILFLAWIFFSPFPVAAQEKTETPSTEKSAENTDSTSSSESTGKLHIEWTPVVGVQGYFVQLKSKQTDSIVFEKRVDTTTVDIEIPPGEYMQRVGVINKFHKVSSFTEWTEFTIIRKITPLIREIQNGSIKIDEGMKLVNIFGEKFQKGAKVKLVSAEGGNVINLTPEYSSLTMLQIKVDPTLIPEGVYHVIVENPGGIKAQKENSVALYMKKPPEALGKNSALAAKGDGFRWTDLIIGVPRIRKGDTFVGSGQILLFSGLVAGSGVESAHAQKIAKNTASSFNYQFYNNIILYSFLSPTFTNTKLLFNLGLKNYLDTSVAGKKYSWHKTNALNLAGAAAAVYLLHIADAFGWIDISLGLSNSTASAQPEFFNTTLAGSDNVAVVPSLELRFSFPIR